MPIHYARSLVGVERTAQANRRLGYWLAAIAGAINAGGFLAVHQYTSHMTGLVSAMADSLALGHMELVAAAAGGMLSFTLGAACTAVLVNFARRNDLQSMYGLPLFVESVLLLVFGLMGSTLDDVRWLFVPVTVMLLCFMMGLQNALITKVSGAEIRTTHVTGLVTDIGIELGKLFYRNSPALLDRPPVVANRERLRVLGTLLGCFLFGGVAGAMGFNHAGYAATLPISLVLLMLGGVPVALDVMAMSKRGMHRFRNRRQNN